MYKNASRFWQGHVFRNGNRHQTRQGSEAVPTEDQPLVPPALAQAHAAKRDVVGTLGFPTKGGWTVWVNGFACFCPMSQLDLEPPVVPVKGARLPFLVIEVAERRAVVSHRAWRDRERAKELSELREACERGSRVAGTVTRMESYGAFVRFRYVTGLVHISKLSEEFVEHPSEIVALGDRVDVVVLAVGGDRRISLRFDRLLPRPTGTTRRAQSKRVPGPSPTKSRVGPTPASGRRR